MLNTKVLLAVICIYGIGISEAFLPSQLTRQSLSRNSQLDYRRPIAVTHSPDSFGATYRCGHAVSSTSLAVARGPSETVRPRRGLGSYWREKWTSLSASETTTEDSTAPPSNLLDTILSRSTSAFPFWVLGSAIMGLKWPSALMWTNQGSLISWMLASVMCATGLTLERKDFTKVLGQDLAAVPAGVLCQFMIMPLSAMLVGRKLLLNAGEVGPSLFLGLCLVGCSPGGTASNLVSLIAKADVALSVLLTSCSTILASFATPLLVKLLVGSTVQVSGWTLCEATARVVLMPVILGMFVNAKAPNLASRVSRFTPFASVLLVSLICGGVVSQNAGLFLQSSALLPLIVGSVVTLHCIGFLFGYMVPRVGLGFSEMTSRTISIETGMQNSALAVVLARSIGAPPAASLPGALSATAHSCLGSVLAGYWHGRRQKEGTADEEQGPASESIRGEDTNHPAVSMEEIVLSEVSLDESGGVAVKAEPSTDSTEFVGKDTAPVEEKEPSAASLGASEGDTVATEPGTDRTDFVGKSTADVDADVTSPSSMNSSPEEPTQDSLAGANVEAKDTTSKGDSLGNPTQRSQAAEAVEVGNKAGSQIDESTVGEVKTREPDATGEVKAVSVRNEEGKALTPEQRMQMKEGNQRLDEALIARKKSQSDKVKRKNPEDAKQGLLEKLTGKRVTTTQPEQKVTLQKEPEDLMSKVKEAGTAGLISYAMWEVAFWAATVPACMTLYHEATGHWPDLSDKTDLRNFGAELFAFANFARFALPFQVGLALTTAPWVQENVVANMYANRTDASRPGETVGKHT